MATSPSSLASSMTFTASSTVLDGHDGDAVQASRALGAELRRPAVVHAGEPGSKHRVLEGGHAQAEAREQHHLVDTVGIGVGEHPVHAPGIDSRSRRQPVLRGTSRARPFVLGIGPPLDQDPELGIGPQRHVVGKALQQLGEELQRFHGMGIGIYDVQVRCHHLSLAWTVPAPEPMPS